MKNIPLHVAVIPDGNRRWARKRGFQPWIGHREGVKSLEKILEKARELKIRYFTFWGGSWDNLTKRSKIEVNFLFKIFERQFKRILKDKKIHQNQVKVQVFGRWQEILPKSCQEAIKKAIDSTKNYNQYYLTFLLAYDGRDEMIDCLKKIVKLPKEKEIKFSPEIIKQNLWTKDLPPVDLVIRAGCKSDPHNSAGFMMWDTVYSQLYFTKTFFPAFESKEFEKIIENYSKRERRKGS